MNRQTQQPTGDTTHDVSFENVAETDRQVVDDHSNALIHSGGPPSYDSLEMLNCREEAPPPSYQEALRNIALSNC